jgi:hypothetical protein
MYHYLFIRTLFSLPALASFGRLAARLSTSFLTVLALHQYDHSVARSIPDTLPEAHCRAYSQPHYITGAARDM